MASGEFPMVNAQWIVVVGRNNLARSSRALAQIVRDLQSLGFAVHGFDPRRAQRSLRLSVWFENLLDGAVAAYCDQTRWGVVLEKSIKAAWLVVHPQGGRSSRLNAMTHSERATKDLRQLLRHWQCRWPERKVHLFAHSAGGIVASQLEDEPNVVSLMCFGYPFRHPQKEEEPSRTAHLQAMRKPFLILQGNGDE